MASPNLELSRRRSWPRLPYLTGRLNWLYLSVVHEAEGSAEGEACCDNMSIFCHIGVVVFEVLPNNIEGEVFR
jgi:hypothetical protein